jgi:DNA primase
MAFRLMKFKNAEAIAPASESSMISEEEINFYKSKYKKICVLFDNDEAGILAMQKYETEYGLPGIVLKMEKDLSDSVKEHGVNNVRTVLYPLITKVLTGEAKYL